jgi:hypothetical protein
MRETITLSSQLVRTPDVESSTIEATSEQTLHFDSLKHSQVWSSRQHRISVNMSRYQLLLSSPSVSLRNVRAALYTEKPDLELSKSTFGL